jgi:hypothetical protein
MAADSPTTTLTKFHVRVIKIGTIATTYHALPASSPQQQYYNTAFDRRQPVDETETMS